MSFPIITLYEDGQSTTKKSSWRVTCWGWVPTMTVKATMPLGYTRSPLKSMRGDSKGRSLLGSTLNCWKFERYMTSTELPLSMRIYLVFNLSIISIMTKVLICVCFTPLASFFKNQMSTSILLLCFRGGNLWTLFTCLCYDFLRDLKDPPVDGPPMIIFISPITLYGKLNILASSLGIVWCLSPSSPLGRLDSPFFTNFWRFPFWMSSSICFFRSLQSSV